MFDASCAPPSSLLFPSGKMKKKENAPYVVRLAVARRQPKIEIDLPDGDIIPDNVRQHPNLMNGITRPEHMKNQVKATLLKYVDKEFDEHPVSSCVDLS